MKVKNWFLRAGDRFVIVNGNGPDDRSEVYGTYVGRDPAGDVGILDKPIGWRDSVVGPDTYWYLHGPDTLRVKSKEDLLRVMARKGACPEARRYVVGHTSSDAETIGLTCRNTEWLRWFLRRVLTRESEQLFSDRRYATWAARAARAYDAAVAERKVVDDCWRAWCRS